MNVLILLLWLFLTPTPPPDTAIMISVHDAQAQPVVGLILTVEDALGSHTLTTDAAGHAVAQRLTGDTVRIRAAHTASGQALQIDPTTVKAGLQLRLLHGATRTAVLLLDATLLQLDPDLVLAGNDQTTPPVASASPPLPVNAVGTAARWWPLLAIIVCSLGIAGLVGFIIVVRSVLIVLHTRQRVPRKE